MTTARFKSRDDYFSKRSNLARRIIEPTAPTLQQGGSESRKPLARRAGPASQREKGVFTSVPVSLFNDIFCRTTESFEIEGRGRFTVDVKTLHATSLLEEALLKHLSGEETVKVNPLDKNGQSAWNVVRFVLSENMDHPFTKAKRLADELQNHHIRSLIEVAEGGKGDYHLWIFHEEPVDGRALAGALVLLGRKLFGQTLETAPSREKEVYVPLPLQGESLLFQRRVFVNGVGKMVKDQASVLRTAPFNPSRVLETFIAEMSAEKYEQKPAPVQETEVRPVITISTGAAQEPSRTRMLVCMVRGVEYGIDADSVIRVMLPDAMTAVPGAAPVKGTVCDNGTDHIISVLDAGHILEGKKCGLSPHSRILIVHGDKGSAGLLVDGVGGISHGAAVRTNTETSSMVSHVVKIDGTGVSLPCIDTGALIALAGPYAVRGEPGRVLRDTRFVVFLVNGLRCGFSAEVVKEIAAPDTIQTRTKTDAALSSVMQYGNGYMPVVDVRRQLEGAAGQADVATKKRRVIVVRAKSRFIGAAVDAIEGVRTIVAGSVDLAPATLMERTPVVGFARETGTSPAFMLLDPDRLV